MKLIQTKDYLLLIDEVAEIKENYFLLDNEYIYKGGADMANESAKKIVSYYPLTKEAKELDLPLLPPFEDDNIEKLADNYAVDTQKVHPADSFIAKQSYIEGYKAAQSKTSFTLEDVKKAIEITKSSMGVDNCGESCYSNKTTDEIIQSLSTQQLPKEFIPEYIDLREFIGDEYQFEENMLKTINSEGKEELVGIYKN